MQEVNFIEQKAKEIQDMIQDIATKYSSAGLGVSIGISLYPEKGKDAITLYKTADEALYTAKSLGKNRYAFAK